jgi:hypothetical protein
MVSGGRRELRHYSCFDLRFVSYLTHGELRSTYKMVGAFLQLDFIPFAYERDWSERKCHDEQIHFCKNADNDWRV